MINPRISADWSTTKTIAAFSCTPRVQEVHSKAEVVHLSPDLLGLSYVHNVSLGKTRRVVSRRYMTDRVAFIVHNGNVNTEL